MDELDRLYIALAKPSLKDMCSIVDEIKRSSGDRLYHQTDDVVSDIHATLNENHWDVNEFILARRNASFTVSVKHWPKL